MDAEASYAMEYGFAFAAARTILMLMLVGSRRPYATSRRVSGKESSSDSSIGIDI
jgi:hypothetical protein